MMPPTKQDILLGLTIKFALDQEDGVGEPVFQVMRELAETISHKDLREDALRRFNRADAVDGRFFSMWSTPLPDTGATWKDIVRKLGGSVERDNDGQLVIYTNLYDK